MSAAMEMTTQLTSLLIFPLSIKIRNSLLLLDDQVFPDKALNDSEYVTNIIRCKL